LLERLPEPTRTAETYAEFMGLSKPERGKIKDVNGGFVGGVLKGGHRTKNAVRWRTLVTLDIDHADKDIEKEVKETYREFNFAYYTTHSHSRLKPRLRLLFPMTRNVTCDEYQALARALADRLGMDYFDNTTYQNERLMFWPSVSKDGDYDYYIHDAAFLDPDSILNVDYFDWQDTSEWPTASDEQDAVKKRAKQQGDPLEKPGVVGLFCRTYTIEEAIEEFLSEDYEPFEEDRYTYVKGSTAGGLVIYRDKNGVPVFAYSHHGTDPTGGTLCNAFDLVRVHLFADEDADTKPGTTVTKLPSYEHMERFMMKDGAVKRQLVAERQAQAAEMFDDIPDDADFDEDEDPNAWQDKLEMNAKGDKILNSALNIRLILENDLNFRGKFAYDAFNNRMTLRGDMPWHRENGASMYWSNTDDACLQNYLEENYGVRGKDRIYNMLVDVMNRHAFHPVRDYLDALEWDGTPRIEDLFFDVLGVSRDWHPDYVRTVTKKILVAAVKRIYEPGCKFDNVLVIVGPQNGGKTTLLSRLGGDWYSDSMPGVQGKDAMEALQGTWLIEIGEMAATRRAENEQIKMFLSKRDDSFRPAYGRYKETFKRQCVFFGTSNTHYFLKDLTGNRRYWPIETSAPAAKSRHRVVNLSQEEIDQVWAEAATLYQEGETVHLSDNEIKEAEVVQAEFLEISPKQPIIEQFLNRYIPKNWHSLPSSSHLNLEDLASEEEAKNDENYMLRDRVCAVEIWVEALHNPVSRFERGDAREINEIIEAMPGWKRVTKSMRFGTDYGPQRGFIRI
jgi:predicted P-loop ATPase